MFSPEQTGTHQGQQHRRETFPNPRKVPVSVATALVGSLPAHLPGGPLTTLLMARLLLPFLIHPAQLNVISLGAGHGGQE